MIYYNPFVKGRKFKNLFLLLASLFFYAWGEPVYVFLMLISISVTWILAFFLRGRYKKVVLTVGIIYHVGVLFIFKYLTFLTSQLGLILNQDFSYIKIALPIGISFFTFQLMSYFLDVYKGEAKPQKNIFNLGLYVSLFPQLIAGPIVRYNEIEEQINTRVESVENVSAGMKRFIYGLSKKLLLADYLSAIADSSFTRIGDQTVVMAWFGILAYSLQIYFDFSGYSDMAIGLGKMFGFEFAENFNYPYISKSIVEFWRRWHISLSRWFRDYVYIFLGGGYGKPLKVAFNLAVVWILTGIWHGANWTFLVWGILYYLLIVVEKFTGIIDKMGKFSRVYTLVAVMLCWVVFRADNLGEAFLYIENMFGINAGNSYSLSAIKDETGYAVILLASVIGCTPLVKKILDKFAAIEGVWILLIFALSLIKATSSSYSPFIYFNF
ncbi:MBOAT family protein [Catonella morbi ATCC 51271]|uniref:MBOAT family protein n=2 Tax=Catonella TaxID=43996 RepID=V2Y7X0_9FIRM|nr:MBOAT family protein [Catonella morbi ATCC 51271]